MLNGFQTGHHMIPIYVLPASQTLRLLNINRRGLRSFDREHAAKLVERGYAQIVEGRLLITEAGKLASRIIAFAPGDQRTGETPNRLSARAR